MHLGFIMIVPGVSLSSVQAASSAGLNLWDSGDLPSFSDVIDIINPLQHIPVISNLYQQETGDTMGSVAKVAGAAILGGPIGGAIALANEIVEAVTGSDVVGHLMGFAGIESSPKGKTEVIIPKPEEAEVAEAVTSNYKDTIRTTTKEWIYGDLA